MLLLSGWVSRLVDTTDVKMQNDATNNLKAMQCERRICRGIGLVLASGNYSPQWMVRKRGKILLLGVCS
jgi:hypothetical protein